MAAIAPPPTVAALPSIVTPSRVRFSPKSMMAPAKRDAATAGQGQAGDRDVDERGAVVQVEQPGAVAVHREGCRAGTLNVNQGNHDDLDPWSARSCRSGRPGRRPCRDPHCRCVVESLPETATASLRLVTVERRRVGSGAIAKAAAPAAAPNVSAVLGRQSRAPWSGPWSPCDCAPRGCLPWGERGFAIVDLLAMWRAGTFERVAVAYRGSPFSQVTRCV